MKKAKNKPKPRSSSPQRKGDKPVAAPKRPAAPVAAPKRPAAQRAPVHRLPFVAAARNPGVGALMLVNPSAAPSPAQGDLFAMSKSETPKSEAPKSETKTSGKKRPTSKRRPADKKPRAASKGRRGGKDDAPSYRELLAQKRESHAKDPERGLKALMRDRKSVLWNARFGTPSAREYLRKHFPEVNPSPVTALKSVGIGVASFLGSRIVSNLIPRVPILNKLGPHGPVLGSAAAGLLTYVLARKRDPELRNPLLVGAGLSFVDTVLRSYLKAYAPSVAGFLGDVGLGDFGLAAPATYDEPVGFLPDEGGMGDLGCDDGMGLGYDVHEALADDGDGLGMDVHEAVAGVEGVDGYVPMPEGTGAYLPAHEGTGAYVPVPEGTGAYVPMEGTDDYDEAMAGPGPYEELDVARWGRGSRTRSMRYTRPMLVRRHGPRGIEYVIIHVHVGQPHARHVGQHHQPQGANAQHLNRVRPGRRWIRAPGRAPHAQPVAAPPPGGGATVPIVEHPIAQPPPAAPAAPRAVGDWQPGGIFASND